MTLSFVPRVVAVFVALALVAPCGRQFGDRRLLTLGWLGTGILVLRAGGSIVQTVYLVAVGRFVANPTMLFELWFYLGAALFALTLRRFYKLRRC